MEHIFFGSGGTDTCAAIDGALAFHGGQDIGQNGSQMAIPFYGAPGVRGYGSR